MQDMMTNYLECLQLINMLCLQIRRIGNIEDIKCDFKYDDNFIHS